MHVVNVVSGYPSDGVMSYAILHLMIRRNHPTDVLPEQVWSVLFMHRESRSRIEVRIDRLEPREGVGLIAHCVSLATGKTFTVRASVLANALRGARLVTHADGRPASVVKVPVVEAKERAPKRAKPKLPRGLKPLSARDIRIRELRAQGLSGHKIAQRVGINESSVREAIANLDDWAAYEGSLPASERTIGLERSEAELRGMRRTS